MIRRALVTITLLLICISSKGEGALLDSLVSVTKEATVSERVTTFLEVGEDNLLLRPDSALILAEWVLKYARDNRAKQEEIRSLVLLGKVNRKLGTFEMAKLNLTNAIKLSLRQADNNILGESLVELALVYQDDWDADSCILINNRALEIFTKEQNDKGMARANSNLGLTYQKMGDLDLAINYHKQALELWNTLDDPGAKGRTLNNLGVCNQLAGKYGPAMEYTLEALKLFEQEGNLDNIGSAYSNIGTLFNYTKDWDNALESYFKARDFFERSGATTKVGNALNNIAIVYFYIGNIEKSEQFFLEGLEERKKMNNQISMANSYHNLGNLYLELKQWDKVEANLLLALEMEEEINNNLGVAGTTLSLADLSLRTKQYNKGITYAKRALRKAIDSESLKLEGRGNMILSALYEGKGDFASALKHHKAFKDRHDSAMFQDNKTKRAELQTKLENAEKEKEIQSLKLEKDVIEKDRAIAELDLQNRNRMLIGLLIGGPLFIALMILLFNRQRKLKDVQNKEQTKQILLEMENLKQKAVRAQLNPHFIFNCMGSIRSLVRKGEDTAALDYLTKFSKLLRRVLENSEYPTIALADEFEGLKLYMDLENMRTTNGFEYDFIVDEKIDIQYIQIPPLVLQPVIENAIWHGISELETKGMIEIEVRQYADQIYQCVVRDNGVGINAETKRQKLNHSSMGMRLVQTLASYDLEVPEEGEVISFKDLNAGGGQGTEVSILLAKK